MLERYLRCADRLNDILSSINPYLLDSITVKYGDYFLSIYIGSVVYYTPKNNKIYKVIYDFYNSPFRPVDIKFLDFPKGRRFWLWFEFQKM